MKLCQACDIIQSPRFINDELTFICELCQLSTKSYPEDTLRKERVKGSNVMIYETILNQAVADPATGKARIKCLNKKCDSNIVKQVVIGEELYLYNKCVKCGFTWLNNT